MNLLKTGISLKRVSLLTLLAFGIIVYAVGMVGFNYIIQYQGKSLSRVMETTASELVRGSSQLLEQAVIDILRQKAEDTAQQLSLLAQGKGREALLKDPRFHEIGVQKIGATGYTCVYDSRSAKMLAHPNKALLRIDMRKLKDTLPEWWKVFRPTLNGSASEGFYDWKDADGGIRKKFMVIRPVHGTNLMTAATMYLDEFTRPMFAIRAEGERSVHNNKAMIAVVARHSYAIIAIISMALFGLISMASWKISTELANHFSKINSFAHELGASNYDASLEALPAIEEFRQVFSSLERMRDRLVSIQKARAEDASSAAAGKISRQVAHDLRAPLSALTLSVNKLKNSRSEESNNLDAIGLLESVTIRLSEMIDSVLKPKMNYLQNVEKFNLTEMIKDVVQEFTERYAGSKRTLEFIFKSDNDTLHMIGSKLNLRRVMVNLVQNSAEAIIQANRDGRIEVFATKSDSNAAVKITDTGIGISSEAMGQIFKEGFTSGKVGGSGIGLYFCQQVISEHGGNIKVRSEAGKRTEFLLTFPVPKINDTEGASTRERTPIYVHPNKKIIVIDDSILMLSNWFKAAIAQGIEGEYFNSFEEAQNDILWEQFSQTYGLVIVDFLIPNGASDGIEICRSILERAGRAVPIYVCTSDFENPRLKVFCAEHNIKILPKTYFDRFSLTFATNVSKKERSNESPT